MTCPKCDGQIDHFAAAPWGDGAQKTSIAPQLCAWCGSLLVLDLKARKLITLEEVSKLTGLDAEAQMRKNAKLWSAIEDARRLILSFPNRRPVLR
jgi:hypothetical protein